LRRCLWTADTNGPVVHSPDGIWAWRAMVLYNIDRRKQKNSEKNLFQCYFVHHIPYGLTRARTHASAVRGRRLTDFFRLLFSSRILLSFIFSVLSFILLSTFLEVHTHTFFTSKCVNNTTQHRRTNTNIHALNGIRSHDPSIQATKTHAFTTRSLWPTTGPCMAPETFVDYQPHAVATQKTDINIWETCSVHCSVRCMLGSSIKFPRLTL
jgi:hypothetical protein